MGVPHRTVVGDNGHPEGRGSFGEVEMGHTMAR